MKKVWVLLILFVLIAGLPVFSSQSGASFMGRLIYVGPDSIEVKLGYNEMTFHVGDTVKVVRNGADVQFSSLLVCQVVKVYYTWKDKRSVATKVVILKESNCH